MIIVFDEFYLLFILRFFSTKITSFFLFFLLIILLIRFLIHIADRKYTMLELNDSQVSIHLCTFEGYFQKAKVNLRFPSLYFVEWKTINAKNGVAMVGRKKAEKSLIQLNQNLTFTTDMLYHRIHKRYLKKQSLIQLNLISNSRPDQVKLVGRVVIDLAQIANHHIYDQITTCKLTYCSIDADISFSIKFVRNIESNLQLSELDRSSFNDLYSFASSNKNLIKNKLQNKQSLSDKKSDDGLRRAKSKFNQKEQCNSRYFKSPTRNGRLENILIKEQVQQGTDVKNIKNQQPKDKNILEHIVQQQKQTVIFAVQQNQTSPGPSKVKITQSGDNLQTIIHKEKQNLQKQINQHKIRNNKLQTDLKEIKTLFEESEKKSENNQLKLIEFQQMFSQIKDNYQKEIANIKENHTHQQSLNIQKISQMQRTINANKTSIDQYVNSIETLKQTIQEYKRKQQQFDTNLLAAKAQSTKLAQFQKKTVDQQQNKLIEHLKYQIETLKNQIQLLKNPIQQKSNTLVNQQIDNQTSQLKIVIQSCKLQLQQYETNLKTIKEESQSLKQQLQFYKQTIHFLQSELQQVKGQLPKSMAPKYGDISNEKTIEIPSLPDDKDEHILSNQNQQINKANVQNGPIADVNIASVNGINQHNQNKQRNQVISITGNLQQKSIQHSNNGSIIEERYNYNFEQPLTNQQVNKIQQSKFHQKEAIALRDQNCKLREEIQQLKNQQNNKQNAVNDKIQSQRIKIQKGIALQQETIKKIEKEKQDLQLQIIDLDYQVKQLNEQLGQSKQNYIQNYVSIDSHHQLLQQMQKYKQQITELETTLTNTLSKNENLQLQLKSFDTQINSQDKEQALVKQLQYRIINLEEDIKIKDQLLAESQKYFIEIYNLRNELAEVTNKYSGIEDELIERDNLIIQLQDTKNQLIKDLQSLTENNNNNYSSEKKVVVKSEESITAHTNVNQAEVNDARIQIETLREELIHMNNKNSQLISTNQDTLNLKSETDRINQELKQQIIKLQAHNQYQIINKELTQLLQLSETKNKELSTQLLDLHQKIDQLTYENQQNLSTISKKSINYSHSEQLNLEIHQVESNINSTLPINYEQSTIPYIENVEKEDIHKQQIISIKTQLQRVKEDYAIQLDLKSLAVGQLQTHQRKIKELQKQVTSLKAELEKVTALHLQSFETIPRNVQPQSIQILNPAKSSGETSIIIQQKINTQVPLIDSQTVSFKKDEQSKIETQVNAASQNEIDLFKKQYTTLKQTFERQEKLYLQLKQIHKICVSKQQTMSADYHNCFEQLKILQEQNTNLNNQKKSIEDQLNYFKDKNVGLEETLAIIEEDYNKLLTQKKTLEQLKVGKTSQQIKNDQISGKNQTAAVAIISTIPDPTPQEKKIKDGNIKNSVPPDPEEARIWRQNQAKKVLEPEQCLQSKTDIKVASIQNASPTSVNNNYLSQSQINIYEQRIQKLTKNQQQLNYKIAHLEQNISNLDKTLQEQIQINQANQQVNQKNQKPTQFQNYSNQIQIQIQELKCENEELRKIKIQYDAMIVEKTNLIKLVLQHTLCVQQRNEWQQKIDSIASSISQNQARNRAQREQILAQKANAEAESKHLQEEIAQFHQQPTNSKPQDAILIEQLKNRQIKLQNDIETLKNQKLNVLEHTATLQETINRLTNCQSSKGIELVEAFTLREQSLEQFKFINMQLKAQIQELKAVQFEQSKQLKDLNKELEQLKVKYLQVQKIAEVLKNSQNNTPYFKQQQLNEQILNLQDQLQVLQEQKNHITLQMTNQLDRMQIELANKIQNIQELQDNLAACEDQINQLKNIPQIQTKGVGLESGNEVQPAQIDAKIQSMTAITQDLHGVCGQIKQLCKSRKSFQQSDSLFQAFIRRYDEIQQQFDNLNNQTNCIQQKARFISKQLQKVKLYIIKSQAKTTKQLLNLLKPCQKAASELVNLSQTLSERDFQAFV